MIDQILSLSFSMHSNPGVYALLLGSGVSRSAGIPTGWEVVLDLIRKIAHLKGVNCEPDPIAWFKKTTGSKPAYSNLLNAVAKSGTERQQLHKSYFEPNEEEREEGLKTPTDAHKAIAELVAKGYIRVIITTNFDRLLEKALEDAGVIPTVISTPGAVDGTIPLIHSKCTIIKVNGDYLDTRLKITGEELSRYDRRINRLLDRVFDEFGLVVCGWSAEWDIALREVIERCKNHRFTTYWTVRDGLNETTEKMVDIRRAQKISISSADSFFKELSEKVLALEDSSEPHPLSKKVAVARLKRFILDDRYKIRLHDLVHEETERLYSELNVKNFPIPGSFDDKEFIARVQRYERLTDTLLALFIHGCYWGGKQHKDTWMKSIERIANSGRERAGTTVYLNLQLYPALLLLYGGGIASVAAERYDTLSSLLTTARLKKIEETLAFVLGVNTWTVIEHRIAQKLPGMERHHVPLSDYLYDLLREPFKDLLPDDSRYQRCFDRFEYLLALVYADLDLKRGGTGDAPVGCFGWRKKILADIDKEMIDGVWPPFKAVLPGTLDGRLESVKNTFDKHLREAIKFWH